VHCYLPHSDDKDPRKKVASLKNVPALESSSVLPQSLATPSPAPALQHKRGEQQATDASTASASAAALVYDSSSLEDLFAIVDAHASQMCPAIAIAILSRLSTFILQLPPREQAAAAAHPSAAAALAAVERATGELSLPEVQTALRALLHGLAAPPSLLTCLESRVADLVASEDAERKKGRQEEEQESGGSDPCWAAWALLKLHARRRHGAAAAERPSPGAALSAIEVAAVADPAWVASQSGRALAFFVSAMAMARRTTSPALCNVGEEILVRLRWQQEQQTGDEGGQEAGVEFPAFMKDHRYLSATDVAGLLHGYVRLRRLPPGELRTTLLAAAEACAMELGGSALAMLAEAIVRAGYVGADGAAVARVANALWPRALQLQSESDLREHQLLWLAATAAKFPSPLAAEFLDAAVVRLEGAVTTCDGRLLSALVGAFATSGRPLPEGTVAAMEARAVKVFRTLAPGEVARWDEASSRCPFSESCCNNIFSAPFSVFLYVGNR
jgi:hypothetical protein